MTYAVRQPRLARGQRATDAPCARAGVCGFTLIEVLVSVAIIGILITISGLTMRGLLNRGVLAQSQNAVLAYAQVARSYAVTNHLETMLVVNPMNGRFEIWHLNPPVQGGLWDPVSNPPYTDGYAFAPVLDSSARLPVDGNDQPMAFVAPIDFESRPHPVISGGGPALEPYMNNLKWAAVCFDEHGQLVIRTRRIATRTFFPPDGTPRPNPNRLRCDETPDLTMRPLVIGGATGDTLITSTCGLVISDFTKMKTAVDVTNVTPQRLVDDWLLKTRPGGLYSPFAVTIVLNRYSGDQQAKDR